jgi:hypothetical protein
MLAVQYITPAHGLVIQEALTQRKANDDRCLKIDGRSNYA